jgi:hypothetical protein
VGRSYSDEHTDALIRYLDNYGTPSGVRSGGRFAILFK